MKYKIGDVVIHKATQDIGEVIGYKSPSVYEVNFNLWGNCDCIEDSLELYNLLLPPGNSPVSKSEGTWTIDEWGGIVESDKTRECDCGALKTYQTMSPEVHARWCSSHGCN